MVHKALQILSKERRKLLYKNQKDNLEEHIKLTPPPDPKGGDNKKHMKEENNTTDWRENLRKNFHVMNRVDKFTLMHQYVTPIKVLKSTEEELIDFIEEQIHLAEESLVMRLREEIFNITERHIKWTPTEGYGSEEEEAYQKGLTAEAKLLAVDILSLTLLTLKPKGDK